MRPSSLIITACILVWTTAEAEPLAHGPPRSDPWAQATTQQQQQPFRFRWPRFGFPQTIPIPTPTHPTQTFELDHILIHGAPRTPYRHIFRRLQVDARVRQEMTHARAAWVAKERSMAVWAYDDDNDGPLDGDPKGPQGIVPPRLQDHHRYQHRHGFEYGVQSRMVEKEEMPAPSDSGQGDSTRAATSFPWPWPSRVPDVEDQETVLALGRMALDCYVDPARQGWIDIGDPWDVSMDIGWMETGLRGYVFASEDKKTIIVGIKGTSLKLFGTGGGPTGNNDKLNDNKMFSCCCGKVDRTWWSVCGCYKSGNQCDQQCLVDDLTKDRQGSESYVGIGLKVIESVQKLYPEATIWLTGHSLGGSVASMLGITYGYPVVAFQAPGDRLYAERTQLVQLGLTPAQLAKYPVWHIGPTADPIYMGTCNGPTSTCYTAGYAMESLCHLGKVCRYDTVGELGWHQGIQHHTILAFLDVVDKWQNLTKGRETVPPCEAQGDCQDCTQWDYV